MDDTILRRIRRIYAAIKAVEEYDPTKLKATVLQTDKIRGFFQDFRGGLSDDELYNLAQMVIHNVANLRDNLRRWASQNGQDQNKVDQAVNQWSYSQILWMTAGSGGVFGSFFPIDKFHSTNHIREERRAV